MSSKVSINLAVFNGEKFIPHLLKSINEQTFTDVEINLWDNNSSDATVALTEKLCPQCKIYRHEENIGFWAAQEKMFDLSQGEIIICPTDVILDKDFVARAVATMAEDEKIGAIQAKIYQMEFYNQDEPILTKIIDTIGFKIFKSRKLINEGHGENDSGQFNQSKEIFGVEGAVPIFRKKAIDDCRIEGHFVDLDYRVEAISYGDDFDFSWRMHLLGWKQIYEPQIIAYHDRSTTKGYSKKATDYLKRVSARKRIDINKRRLDWVNSRLTILKNDYMINILEDLPRILAREIAVLVYSLIFEPGVLKGIFIFISKFNKMLAKRKLIMARASVSPREMRKFFN
jgi:GT2 family glycosyltransferase